jgi:hypothetical protein
VRKRIQLTGRSGDRLGSAADFTIRLGDCH